MKIFHPSHSPGGLLDALEANSGNHRWPGFDSEPRPSCLCCLQQVHFQLHSLNKLEQNMDKTWKCKKQRNAEGHSIFSEVLLCASPEWAVTLSCCWRCASGRSCPSPCRPRLRVSSEFWKRILFGSFFLDIWLLIYSMFSFFCWKRRMFLFSNFCWKSYFWRSRATFFLELPCPPMWWLDRSAAVGSIPGCF